MAQELGARPRGGRSGRVLGLREHEGMVKLFSKGPRAAEPGGPGGSGGPAATGGPPALAASASYDKLEVVTESGETRWMTREHFEALPLVDRVRLLASGGLSFYREGCKVSSLEAMRTTR
jgi:hypothetical protein